jgi:hypothetical protein
MTAPMELHVSWVTESGRENSPAFSRATSRRSNLGQSRWNARRLLQCRSIYMLTFSDKETQLTSIR